MGYASSFGSIDDDGCHSTPLQHVKGVYSFTVVFDFKFAIALMTSEPQPAVKCWPHFFVCYRVLPWRSCTVRATPPQFRRFGEPPKVPRDAVATAETTGPDSQSPIIFNPPFCFLFVCCVHNRSQEKSLEVIPRLYYTCQKIYK